MREGTGMEWRAGGLFENVVYERIANEKRASENQISEKSAVAEPFPLFLSSLVFHRIIFPSMPVLLQIREKEREKFRFL